VAQPFQILADIRLKDAWRQGFAIVSKLKDEIGTCDFDEVFWDPIEGTVFLRPVQLTPEWSVTAGEDYARFRQANTSVADDPNWEEINYRFSGDVFLAGKDPLQTKDDVITFFGTPGQGLAQNRGLFLEFFAFGRRAQNYELVRLVFGGYTFALWSNGYMEWSDDTTLLAWGYIQKDHRIDTGIMQRLLIMPLRRNQVLFWLERGGALLWTHPTLDYARTDNVITAASQPTIQFPGGKGFFQLSFLTFKSPGSIRGPVTMFPYVPTPAATMESVIESDVPSGCGFVQSWLTATDPENPDPLTDAGFTPDGEADNAYYYITMSSSPPRQYTPTLYRIELVIGHELRDPYTSVNDLTPLVTEAKLSVGEEGETSLSMTVKEPDTVEGLDQITNVHVRLLDATDEFFYGMTGAPEFEDAPRDPNTTLLRVEVRDMWKRLMNFRLSSDEFYDGQLHQKVIEKIALKAGFSADDLDIDPDTIYLPYSYRDDDPKFRPRDGMPADEFMRYVKDNFSQWELECRPSKHFGGVDSASYRYVLAYKDPYLRVPTVKALFDPTESGTGLPSSATELRRTYVPPEANEVWVIGFESTGRPLAAYYVDYDSQDATLAPADRPTNWTGERWLVVYIDPALTTIEDVSFACSMLSMRTTLARERVTFASQWNTNAQRKDWIYVKSFGLYQVEAYDVEFALESTTLILGFEGLVRNAQYVAERYLAPDEGRFSGQVPAVPEEPPEVP